MKTKRFASLALAGVLSMSMVVPAFASKSVKVTGTYKDIPISVVVPTTGTVTINPYGLPVTFTKSDEKTASISGQQITTAPLAIKNQGTVGLTVGASVTGKIKTGSTMTLSPTTTQDSTPLTTKTAFVKLEVVGLTGTKWKVADDEKLADLIIDEAAKTDTWASPTEGPVVEADKTNSTTDDEVLATLQPAIMDATTGEFSTYGGSNDGSSIALFRLGGDCVTSPKKTTGSGASAVTSDDSWTSKDGFDVTIAFTFTPVAS